MSILGWIILGGLAGWIASALTGSADGCLMDIVIGVAGAIIGGFIFSLLGHAPVMTLSLGSLFVAVVGAVVLLLVVRTLRKRD
ncbi:MAG: GlsB/YeaQ/YmgE family stress response membrane protein [Armatimonadota bacterium]